VLNKKLSISYTHEDCITRCVPKVQQEDKFDGIPQSIQMKAKIIVLKYYENNLVHVKDNSANQIDEMASMLWDIIASCGNKHI
jgi:hypothetical protein